jgi:hypothetical protein
LTGMTVLLLIFVPKVHFLQMYTQSPEEVRKEHETPNASQRSNFSFLRESKKLSEATKSSSIDLSRPGALEESRQNQSPLLHGDDSRSFQ